MSACTLQVHPRKQTLDIIFCVVAAVISSAFCFTCQRPVFLFEDVPAEVFVISDHYKNEKSHFARLV
jgi:hypothetical protein